jgi:hypothetical protein
VRGYVRGRVCGGGLCSEHAQMFNRASTRLRREMWWQSVRMKILIGVGVVAAIVVLAYALCGWGMQACGG